MKINSWADFTTLIDEYTNYDVCEPHYLFRGQSNCGWGLLPAFSRMCFAKPNDWCLKKELSMLKIFRLDAHNYIQKPILPEHTRDIELWWSVMQHYGVPTRLLDWSCSPYVALYFSVSSLSNSDAALWIVNPRVVNLAAKSRYQFSGDDFLKHFIVDEDTNLTCFYEPATKTDRMSAQQGWFSISANPGKDHEKTIREECGDDVLRKIIIPKELKKDFLIKLHAMNINSRTIFPGLDGLGKSIHEYLAIESYELK